MTPKTPKILRKIAIFASGSGSNAQKLMEHFKDHESAEVALLLTNNPYAYVLQRADNYEVPSHVFDKKEFYDSDAVLTLLKKNKIDFIVLAGFLWLMPPDIISAFPGRIVNIHPSLLPKFGGKGMYGKHVHEAVLNSHEKETGITIHYVNEHFDEGEIIHQSKLIINPGDDLETLMYNVRELEHHYFPKIVETLVRKIK